jgi:GNAT superfamily N-acetyltransferase
MAVNIKVTPIQQDDYYDISVMVRDLLNEIMEKINAKAFDFQRDKTESRAKELVSINKYWIFVAKDADTEKNLGFVSLYESYALYAEGAYGTIPELYVRPGCRSKSVGRQLLEKVIEFSREKGWHRIEVTTPPLPEFERTLQFYQANGFEITGGRKLKINVIA